MQAKSHLDATKQNSEKTPSQQSTIADADFSSSHSAPMANHPFFRITSNSARVAQMEKMRAGSKNTREMSETRQALNQQALQLPFIADSNRLPKDLKNGIESLSGLSLDHVRVHYNSPRPEQIQAHGFAQGSDIYLGPGQEEHLPHEAWHVVQQAQGRVATTMQLAGTAVNDNDGLEREADVMGARATTFSALTNSARKLTSPEDQRSLRVSGPPVLQRRLGVEIEASVPFYGKAEVSPTFVDNDEVKIGIEEGKSIVNFLYGAFEYGANRGGVANLYEITADTLAPQLKGYSAMRDHVRLNYLEDKTRSKESPKHGMSNLEYVTPPFREGEDSDAINRSATLIQTHVEATFDIFQRGLSQQVPHPAVEGSFTGIPVPALTKLLTNDPVGLGLLNDMKDARSYGLYYQVTTGVLPSEISDLFSNASAEFKELGKTSKEAPTAEKALLASRVLDIAQSSTRDVMKRSAAVFELSEIEKAALSGWLMLVGQYLTASFMEATNWAYDEFPGNDGVMQVKRRQSHEKNLIPYLLRSELSATVLAIPQGVRNKVNTKWEILLLPLLDECDRAVEREFKGKGALKDFRGLHIVNTETLAGKQPLILTRATSSRHEANDYRKVWMAGFIDVIKNIDKQDHAQREQFREFKVVQAGTSVEIEDDAQHGQSRIASGEKVIPLERRLMELKEHKGQEHKGPIIVIGTIWDNAVRVRNNSIDRINREMKIEGGSSLESKVAASPGALSSGSPSAIAGGSMSSVSEQKGTQSDALMIASSPAVSSPTRIDSMPSRSSSSQNHQASPAVPESKDSLAYAGSSTALPIVNKREKLLDYVYDYDKRKKEDPIFGALPGEEGLYAKAKELIWPQGSDEKDYVYTIQKEMGDLIDLIDKIYPGLFASDKTPA